MIQMHYINYVIVIKQDFGIGYISKIIIKYNT
jgi:hypothetical protein